MYGSNKINLEQHDSREMTTAIVSWFSVATVAMQEELLSLGSLGLREREKR